MKPRYRVIFREDRLFHYGDPILQKKQYKDLMSYFRMAKYGYMIPSKESGVDGMIAYMFEIGNEINEQFKATRK